MRRALYIAGFLAVVALVIRCIDPYSLPDKNAGTNILVVDAFLNGQQDTLGVRLSFTKALNSSKPGAVVSGAIITLADESGSTVSIPERTGKKGSYFQGTLPLNTKARYQLRIKTSNGRTYASDWVNIQQTPAIDSVTWKVNSDGLNFYVSTHDPANLTDYYRWEYLETYQYTSANQSYLIYDRVKKQILDRTLTNQIYNCWKTAVSKNISLRSVEAVGGKVVTDFNFLYLPSVSKKIAIKYSVLVRQYSLDKAAYDYWLNLEKNSQSLGSLFDPQPSELRGNVSNVTDPTETVLGYFGASTVTEKRVTVAELQLRPYSYAWKPDFNFPLCDTAIWVEEKFVPNYKLLILQGRVFNDVQGYDLASTNCTDCRASADKGTNVKPPFWE